MGERPFVSIVLVPLVSYGTLVKVDNRGRAAKKAAALLPPLHSIHVVGHTNKPSRDFCWIPRVHARPGRVPPVLRPLEKVVLAVVGKLYRTVQVVGDSREPRRDGTPARRVN